MMAMATKSTRPPIIRSLEPSASQCSTIKLSRNEMVKQSAVLLKSALSGERGKEVIGSGKNFLHLIRKVWFPHH